MSQEYSTYLVRVSFLYKIPDYSKGRLFFPVNSCVFGSRATNSSISKDRDVLLPSAQQVCDVTERHAITLQSEQ